MSWKPTLRRSCKRLATALPALLLFIISFAQNPVVTENALPGSPISEWGVPDFRDSRIAGFSTKMSLNSGETVQFKITVEAVATYTIKIYRIGYYAGNGARLVQDLGVFNGVVQPNGISDPVTGVLDCSNWSESASWNIPSSAVSGLYIAKLERTGGGSNHIAFIVRNDASNSALYLQFPDATWQAYNGYGGNSLYDGNTSFPGGHAVKVSYNRPFFPYNSLFNTDGRESDWYMNAIYPMIRWLERNGYDITYTSSNDIDNNGSRLLNHKVFISAGHDEYWSKEQRNNVEAARNAGVHLAFFSGNEVYWKTRWESNDGTEDRVLVCYKEGFMGDGSLGERSCGGKCDVSSTEWTGLWRTGADYDAGRPENALTGQISWDEVFGAIQVPSKYKKIRFWRNTTIPNLVDGQTATLAPNTLAHEWDFEQSFNTYPAGRITMSSTTLNNHTHKLSLYRHASGALVFGAGTVQWSWGLDGGHLGGSPVISQEMQQATVNLFADMDVQPATLQADLTPAAKSTDLIPPSSVILSPANGSTTPAGAAITFTGTATDAGGGVASGVEISTDGGTTWRQTDINAADASITWSYTWVPNAEGTATIKTRAFDDNGNKENPGAGITITVSPAVCPCTIFQPVSAPAKPLNNDGLGGIELGVRFRSSQNGFITGIRYYKGAGTTGTHTGSLWTNTGVMLAQATFTDETASGWQQVSFSSPVAITAGVTYVASQYSPSGEYPSTVSYFTQAVVNSPLTGLADGEDGINGVYKYSASSVFPTDGNLSTNYWVDVVFNTGSSGTSPVISLQPSAQAVCAEKNVSFSSAANGDPAPTVQWQSSPDGTTWTDIDGATSSTLSFTTAITDNNKQYRAVWKNSEGTVNSDAATLTVNAIPVAPAVTVSNNCGNSILTAGSFTGSLLWSNGATTSSITVTTAGTYTVTQTIGECTSPAGSGIASPKENPVLSGSLTATVNSDASFVYTPASTVSGTVFTWSRAAIPGIKNAAANGSGNIVETLVNATNSPVKVTYLYTLTANGCTNMQELVVTVRASRGSSCVINTSIESDFNSTPIPAGRYIWFNSSFDPASFGKFKTEPVTIVVTNSWINFKANNKQYTLKVPDSHIRFDKNVIIASTRFTDNRWETTVPFNFSKDIFMGGLSYLVPVNLPGNIRDIKWTSDVNIDKAGISLSWKWAAAVYTKFANHAGLNIKPAEGLLQIPYLSTDKPGTPENYKAFVTAGAKGKGKKSYTGDDSKKRKVTCKKKVDDDDDDDKPLVNSIRDLLGQLSSLTAKQSPGNRLDIQASPNPTNNYVSLAIRGEIKNTVTVSILDIFGQVVEKHDRIASNSVLKVGETWKNGIYFAVVVQGDQRKIIKIIKAN